MKGWYIDLGSKLTFTVDDDTHVDFHETRVLVRFISTVVVMIIHYKAFRSCKASDRFEAVRGYHDLDLAMS